MKNIYRWWMIGISIAIFVKLVDIAEYLKIIATFID